MMVNILVSLLIGILVGYELGFKIGKEKGEEKSLAQIPLIILQKSMEKGYCLICERKIQKSGRNSDDNIETNNNK